MHLVQVLLVVWATIALIVNTVLMITEENITQNASVLSTSLILEITDILLVCALLILALSHQWSAIPKTLQKCCIQQPLTLVIIIIDGFNLAIAIAGPILLHSIRSEFTLIYISTWVHIGINLICYTIAAIFIFKRRQQNKAQQT